MDADGSNVRVVTPEPLPATRWWDWTPTGDIAVVTTDTKVYDGAGVGAAITLATGIDVDVLDFRPPDGRILFRGRVGDALASTS